MVITLYASVQLNNNKYDTIQYSYISFRKLPEIDLDSKIEKFEGELSSTGNYKEITITNIDIKL